MRLATTTGDTKELTRDPFEAVSIISEGGFKHIDLSLYTIDSLDNAFMKDGWEDYTLRLKAHAESLGCDFVQCHAPGSFNPFEQDAEKRERLINATKRSLEVCSLLGIKNNVLHTGWKQGITREDCFKENLSFLRNFLDTAEKCGVNLLIENSTRVNMGEMYHFYRGSTMREFIEYASHPLIHACWDVGHAHLEHSNYDDIVDLADELYALHIHDNRNGKDEHLLPYSGTINMDEIIHALIKTGYKGYFTFECEWLIFDSCYRKQFASDDRLLRPSREVFVAAEGLRYAVGKHFLSSYGIFED
jgi:sugar phosphate isomerase/epimerase